MILKMQFQQNTQYGGMYKGPTSEHGKTKFVQMTLYSIFLLVWENT